MPDRSKPEFLFLEHLGWINRVAAMACAEHAVEGAEAEDFASFVRMKLMEDDYAAIRRCGRDSKLKTYLAMMVVRQFHDYWRERRGRWRPSAAAERLGPLACELERLVYRTGFTLAQAGEKLRTSGYTVSNAELARLLAKLPQRAFSRPVEVPAERVLIDTASPIAADAGLEASEEEARQGKLLVALDRAMAQLSSEERMIVRMHFQDRRPLAEVARALRVEQKPLYRRVTWLQQRLREYLEDVQIRDFRYPGILGPDGLPMTQETLRASRIITDVISANEAILTMVQNDPSSVYGLSPRQFEELVAELLHQQGYEVALTPPSRDGGFDMYAARKDGLGEFMYLVECKRYSQERPVGVDIVRALYGVVEKQEASAGVLVTTSRFTKGAAEFQRSVRHRLSLRDYLDLQEWLAATR